MRGHDRLRAVAEVELREHAADVRLHGNQLVRVDPSARRAVGATRTGTGVRQVVAAFGGLWTADSTAGSISRVPLP